MPILMVGKNLTPASSCIGDTHGIIVCAEDADEAISLLRFDSYDLVLIDMASLPEDGFDLIRRLRTSGNNTPVLALTGSRLDSRTEALGLGADEALADPVDPAELDASMAAILQRTRGGSRPELRLGDLRLCLSTGEAQFRRTPLNLTATEFSMFELLVRRKGSVLTKAAFLHHLYGEHDKPDGKIIEVLICKLRKKLDRAGAGPLISVVWGHGYTISELDALRQRISDTVTGGSQGLVA